MGTEFKTTIIDRIRYLGLEPDNRLDWMAGDQARKEYEIATGELPRKALRQKTNGSGSHCFATYPDWFVPRIDKIITDYAELLDTQDAAQQRLFDE